MGWGAVGSWVAPSLSRLFVKEGKTCVGWEWDRLGLEQVGDVFTNPIEIDEIKAKYIEKMQP